MSTYYAKNSKDAFDVTASYTNPEDVWDCILWDIPDVVLSDWDIYNSETNEIVKFPCSNERCNVLVQHPETPCERCDY